MACKYEILTEEGFKDFDDVVSMGVKNTIKLYFSDGTTLQCTSDHLIMTKDGWKESGNIKINELVKGNSEYVSLMKVGSGDDCEVFDVLNVKDTNSFYCNDVLVHNCSFMLLDEFAFVPKNMADEFFRSVYPTISSGKESKIAIISTPYGMNHYYKLWNEAVTGKNDYVPHLADWTCVPGRNEEWKIETIRNIGEEAFRQEFEVEFQGSSGTLISGNKLKSMTYRDPIFQDSDGLKIYYTPEKDHSYIMTVDVSEGTGLDFHAINVIDITDYPYQQVAVFRNQFLDTVLLPDAILSLGEKYNDAFVLIEINSIGQTVAEILFTDLEYEHLMFTTMSGRKGQVLGGGFSGKTQYGLKMTKQSKRIGCSLLKTLIENDQLIINDYDTYSELTTFVRNKGSYEAEVGCNDDSVMSLVSFAWITGQQYFKEDMEQDLRQNINRKVVDHLEEMLVPFGVIDDGTEYMSNEDLIRKSMEINYDDF